MNQPMQMIEVERIDHPGEGGPQAALRVGTGRLMGTTARITFAVDWRSAMGMEAALASGEPVVAMIEPWMVMGRHN